MSKIMEQDSSIIKSLAKWENDHPYITAFVLSCLIVSYAMFSTPSVSIVDKEVAQTENISIVNIDQIQAPKRIVKKQYSTEKGEVSDTSNVDRARGVSDNPNAVDISFFPNIAPPKPAGRLKDLYPDSAKKENVEATVLVELLIAASGIVTNVKVLAIKLTKALPPTIQIRLFSDFGRDARRILKGAQFTPPIVNGKRVPIKMEMPLRFRLRK